MSDFWSYEELKEQIFISFPLPFLGSDLLKRLEVLISPPRVSDLKAVSGLRHLWVVTSRGDTLTSDATFSEVVGSQAKRLQLCSHLQMRLFTHIPSRYALRFKPVWEQSEMTKSLTNELTWENLSQRVASGP